MVVAKDVPVIDTFQFAGTFLVPATVSFLVKWEATGPQKKLGSGKAVRAEEPCGLPRHIRTGPFHRTVFGRRTRL